MLLLVSQKRLSTWQALEKNLKSSQTWIKTSSMFNLRTSSGRRRLNFHISEEEKAIFGPIKCKAYCSTLIRWIDKRKLRMAKTLNLDKFNLVHHKILNSGTIRKCSQHTLAQTKIKQTGHRKKAENLKSSMTINSTWLIAAPRQALTLAKTVAKEMITALSKVVREDPLRAFQFLKLAPRSTPSTKDWRWWKLWIVKTILRSTSAPLTTLRTLLSMQLSSSGLPTLKWAVKTMLFTWENVASQGEISN